MVQFQGGSFDPGEVGDPSDVLQRSFTQQNRGWQRTAAMLKQNQDTQIRSAGKLWGQLEELAPSVNKLLQTKNVEWAKDQDAIGREFLRNNPPSAEDKAAYEQELRDIGKSAAEANAMADEWEAKGGDIWTSEAFRKLSPQSQVAAVQGQIARTMAMYNPSADPRVLNATSPTEKVAAMAAYRHEFWKNFDGLDEKMVHFETSDKMDAIEAADNKSWNATRTKEIKEQRLEEATDTLITGLKGDNPAEAVLLFAETQLGTYGGVIGQSRRAAIEIIEQSVENGSLNRWDIEKLKKAKFKARDGTDKVFGEYYKGDFHAVKVARNKFLNQNYKIKSDGVVRAKGEMEDSVLEDMKKETDPTKLDNKWFDDRQDRFVKKFGVKSEKIAKLKANNSAENITYNANKKELDKEVEMGILTESSLANVGGKLRQEYLAIAKAMDKNSPIRNGHLEALENLPGLPRYVKNTLGGKQHHSVGQVGDRLKSRYLTLARQLDIAGVENPNQVAFDRINDWFENAAKNNSFRSHNGYNLDWLNNKKKGITPLKGNEKRRFQDFVARANDLRADGIGVRMVDEDNNPLDETPFFTKQELKAMERNYGKHGWHADPKVNWMARRFNIRPMDIINQSRVALELDPLPDSRPDLERWQNMNAEARRKMADERVTNITTRSNNIGTYGFTKVGGVSYATKEKTAGKEKEIEQVTKETGIDEDSVAAGMYMNELFPTLLGRLGIVDNYIQTIWNQVNYATSSDPTKKQQFLDNTMDSRIILPNLNR